MNFTYFIIIFQIILSTVVASNGLWVWNKKDRSIQSDSLLVLYMAIAVWVLINMLEILAVGFENKYIWARLQYIPLVILPVAWFCFTQSYSRSQYQLGKIEYASIIFIGTAIAVIALTNDTHHLFWSEVMLRTVSDTPYLDLNVGIAFIFYVIYMLVLIFIGIYQLITSIRISGPMRSWQSTLLLISVIAVFVSIMMDVSKTIFFPEPELTSLVLACVVPLVGHILDKLNYADIMPAAYYQVFEHLEDGVIVTTPNQRIIDMNKRARALAVNTARDQLNTLNQVFPFLVPVQNGNGLIDHSSPETPLILDMSTAPIKDNRSQIQSQIILLRDVTEHHTRENILVQRNQELEILNQISGYASSSRNLSEILTFVVELSCITFKSTSAYIAKVDQPQNDLTVMAGFVNPNTENDLSAADNMSQKNYKISETTPHLMEWLNDPTNHNISHFNPSSDEQYNKLLATFSVQSVLSFPIQIKGDLYGFISIVEAHKHRDFEASEIQLLQLIANQMGSAIENAQLYSALTRQIEERSIAEEQLRNSLNEKDTLLKEVHHRVKNNLQVISSLLRLQLTSVDDPRMTELIQDSQSRIQSMALVHELLYQSEDLSTINLGEYLEFLSHSLMASYQSRTQQIDINTQCHDFNVTIETAITCGLLLNELVSNAIKHAFPQRESGTIDVSIEPAEEQKMLLTVQDDGIGIAMTPQINHKRGNSLGLKLIDSFVNQLNAQMDIKSDSGTCYEITIPIHK